MAAAKHRLDLCSNPGNIALLWAAAKMPCKYSSTYMDIMLSIYKKITATGLHNYVHARLPLITNLNIKLWGDISVGYHNAAVVQHFKYEFPVSYIL